MKCDECEFHTEIDYGYSDYTVEGVDIDCDLGKNPFFPIDRWYGEYMEEIEYANKCPSFSPGAGTHIDVDADADN